METTIVHVIVLQPAGGAHWEDRHGRPQTIVRNTLDDRVTRTTVSAIGEWISVAPVMGVREFINAGIAGGDIGRNKRKSVRFFRTFPDGEFRVSPCGDFGHFKINDLRQRRKVFAQRAAERVQDGPFAFGFDDHSPRGITDKTGNASLLRQSMHERTKSHALDNAEDEDSPALRRLRESALKLS